MQDLIIAGTGNSRTLKSVSDFLTQYPTYADFVAALVAGTLPVDIGAIDTDHITQEGTALNKANILPDATATALFAALGVMEPDEPVIKDVFDAIYTAAPYRPNGTDVAVADGGTGAGTASAALLNLISGLSAVTPASGDYLPFHDVSGATSGKVTLANLAAALLGESAGIAKVEVGSYVGTGSYGAANPNTLTLSAAPKLVILQRRRTTESDEYPEGLAILTSGMGFAYVHLNYVEDMHTAQDAVGKLTCSISGNAISWYSADSLSGLIQTPATPYVFPADVDSQFNCSGLTYGYIAIELPS